MERIPIYDNHIHMDPKGRNLAAIKDFVEAGGTGFTLVNMPYHHIPVSTSEDLLKGYETTMSQAITVREKFGLKVNVAVGPYPVLLIGLAERFGIEEAEKIMIRGMDIAAELVAEGRVEAIGEVGRPHFPVSDQINEASERILQYGMEKARECSCPVIIHSESSDETMQWLADVADKARLDRGMVIKHVSPPLVLESENKGILPSVAASRSSIREAVSKGNRFMLETDYIDSLERPDVVLPVTTVPKRIKGLLSSGELSDETVWKICSDIPERMYSR